MKKLMLPPILLFLLFIGCSEKMDSKIDRLFEAYQGKVPGASLLVIRDGKKIIEKSYGMADIEKNIPVDPATNFRLASVTKQFTAMCVMMLARDGKLDIDQDLQSIFPDFPEYGHHITIRNLLQHTSGLFAYENLIPDSATIQVHDADVLHMMMTRDSTYFSPGSKYRYSNSGYAVLAMIVEKVSGQKFARFLNKRIFEPLNMINTMAYEKGQSEVIHRAYGYAVKDSGFIFKDQSLTSAVLGDGGIYTSVEDMYQWDQALYTEKLLPSHWLNQAFTSGRLNNGELINYGFGWRIDRYRSFKRWHHTGGTCGFRNVIQRYPDQKLTIIILTNRNEPDVSERATQLFDLIISE